jgi:hypothetical protein
MSFVDRWSIAALLAASLVGVASADEPKKCSPAMIQLGFCDRDGYEQRFTEEELDLFRNATAEDFEFLSRLDEAMRDERAKEVAALEQQRDAELRKLEQQMDAELRKLDGVIRENPTLFEALVAQEEHATPGLERSRPPAPAPLPPGYTLPRLEIPALKTPEGRRSARSLIDGLSLEAKPSGPPRPALVPTPIAVPATRLPEGTKPIDGRVLQGTPPTEAVPGGSAPRDAEQPAAVPVVEQDISWSEWLSSWW